MSIVPNKSLLKKTEFWQFLAAAVAVGGLILLAHCRIWPFGTSPPDLGKNPSIFEVLLFDRLMIGFIRAGLVGVVIYVVISIPALVVDRRWMKGLSTAGLTADEARKGDQSIEELQATLRETQEELDFQNTQNDLLSELLLEYRTEQEDDDSPPEGGEPNGPA